MAKRATSSNSSEFHVILQGLKLSAEAEKRIEIEIRKIVMSELATIDLKGDLQISPIEKFPALVANSPFRPGGGHTAGIFIADPLSL
jgi:hypothetical protein